MLVPITVSTASRCGDDPIALFGLTMDTVNTPLPVPVAGQLDPRRRQAPRQVADDRLRCSARAAVVSHRSERTAVVRAVNRSVAVTLIIA